MKNQNITPSEIEVLTAIYYNDYQSGDAEERIGNPIWMIQECDVTLKGKELSGVCSSLSKKGLMDVQKDGKNSACWLTQAGYDVLLENGMI